MSTTASRIDRTSRPPSTGRWSETEARRYLDRYEEAVGADRALRVYSSRLIGGDADLVLHGGGNTSVKGHHRTLTGSRVEAIYVKGSGWDLSDIEPEGLPGMRLEPLRELRALPGLDDAAMVNQLRTNLFDAGAPTPSVETLLHAFLPHRFVDHSHADAIIALTNQREGERFVREALGERVAILPYVMPGFDLAVAAAEAYERRPEIEGLVLMKHGLVTFGETARESYERHVELVALAAELAAGEARPRPAGAPRTAPDGLVADALPALRGAVSIGDGASAHRRRFILDVRRSADIVELVDGPRGATLAALAPLTPDHTIRTKPWPLHLAEAPLGDPAALARIARAAAAEFGRKYDRYVDRGAARREDLTRLDNAPRVLLVPGLGLIGVGDSKSAAAAAADIAEHTLRVKDLAERVDAYEGLGDDDLFDMEYWSLEQAKLAKARRAALTGQVALVTGSAGAIGVGVAEELLREGAHVMCADVDLSRLSEARDRLLDVAPRDRIATQELDVTDEDSVRECFRAAAHAFGGVDIVVASAGVASVARIEDAKAADYDRLADVNGRGTFLTLREAARLMRLQDTQGSIVIVSSKNVFGPGAAFGAYSASKAAAHQLGRVAAMELGELGIRVNMVNADAVFGDDRTASQLWREVGPARAAARDMDEADLPDFYRRRTLLGAEVTAADVGRAVTFLASGATPTTGAVIPVDGGVPEAFPR